MATKKSCLSCGDSFIGRSNAAYCSPTCRLRAHRGRDSPGETVSARRAPKAKQPTDTPRVTVGGHSDEALALLSAINAEAAENAEARGEPPLEDGEDDWTAAERTVLELIADSVDRKVELAGLYAATEDVGLKVKLSGELRLLEANVARLLKQVKTDLPPEPSNTSRKASDAAKARWRRDRNGPGPA